jgi:hypothetical protein
MGGAHPSLEGPERVFDGLWSHAHGVGHAIEPILHPVEHISFSQRLMIRRWVGVHRGLSGQVKQALRAVAVEVFRVIRAAINFGEFCTAGQV